MTVIPYIAASFTQSLEWRTEVQQSWDGHETRAALLHAPREEFDLSLVLSIEEARALRSLLFADPAGAFEIPLATEEMPARAAITATSIIIDSTYLDWPAIGARIMVQNAAGAWYATSVTGVAGHPGIATLTVANGPTGGTYPAGSRVRPLVAVVLDDPQATGAYLEETARWSLKARGAVIRPTWGTGATLTMFDDLVVADEDLVLDGVLAQEQAVGGSELLDAGAAIARERSWDAAQIKRTVEFETEEPVRRQWVKKFLQACRGRWKPFLLPTGRDDLALDEQPGEAATTLVITDAVGYVARLWPSTAHRWLRLHYDDGTSSMHTIDAAVDNMDGTQDLTIDPATSAGDIEAVELMELCRLENDSVTVAWPTGYRASVEFGAVVVQSTVESAPVTYAAAEAAQQSSEPIELYVFTVGATVYRYTSYAKDFSYAAQTYTALPGLSRSKLGGSQSAPNEIEISLPASSAFAQAQLTGILPRSIGVTITRYQATPAAAQVVWVGTIVAPLWGGRMVRARSVSAIDKAFRREIPSVRYTRGCGHVLFDNMCKIVATDHDLSTTISTVSGRDVTLAGIGGNPDGWADGGELVRTSDGERRTVLTQVGAVLELEMSFKTLTAADAVVLYRGCAHTIEACDEDFDNRENFGGFPYIPRSNIWKSGLRGNPDI